MSLTSLPLGNMIMESAYLTTSRYIGDQHTLVARKRRQQRKRDGDSPNQYSELNQGKYFMVNLKGCGITWKTHPRLSVRVLTERFNYRGKTRPGCRWHYPISSSLRLSIVSAA